MTNGQPPHGTVSIPQWAHRSGLADDGRSIAAARGLIAQGDGPDVVQIGRLQGVRLQDSEAWAKATPWAKYAADLAAAERDKIINFVGDVAYAAKLYDRYCASRWRRRMTFEKWLKRRQRLKDRSRKAKNGGTK